MKVLITGGTGAVGTTATKRFIENGWDVRVIGLEPENGPENEQEKILSEAEYIQGDITDYPTVCAAVEGCNYVVHLAAIANPMVNPGQQVFHVNAGGTYNVFEAAAQAGIKRIVQASSLNAFGCFWGTIDRAPEYLPLDEEQARYTTDAYSFSKQIIEDIGDYYWRREGISSVALRFPGVWSEEHQSSEALREQVAEARRYLDEFMQQPEAKRIERIEEAQVIAAAYRKERRLEYPGAANGIKIDGFPKDRLWRFWVFDRLNYWSYVGARDAAQAMEKGLTASYEGSHPLFITAATNWLDYSTSDLLRYFYPDVSEYRGALSGSASLISTEKAQQLIGYEPEY